MQMKFFQPLAYIQRHYEDIFQQLKRPDYGHSLLETWNIDPKNDEQIAQLRREAAAIQYLVDCRLEIAQHEDLVKPELDVLKSALERHQTFLCDIFGVTADNWRQLDELSRKEYEACTHYLFKITQPAWVAKLPDRILTFENKYPDFNKPLPID